MRVHDLKNAEGRIYAFEVANHTIGRSGALLIVESIPGVQVVRRPLRWSWFREETFCEFDIDGRRFSIWEPFGDSSRYWIGPEPPEPCKEIDIVRAAFLQARPWPIWSFGWRAAFRRRQ
jgi:hypothetical protein